MRKRYLWSSLNHLQVGAYTEYFVKMELTMYGLQVYSTEIDDRGIDLVTRYENGPYLDIQVKSLRSYGYIFMPKDKFIPNERLYVAVGLLFDGHPPDLFLIPSIVWNTPDPLFVSHDYVGKKSKPEWGLNISKKNMPALEQYRFEITVEKIATG